MKLVLQHRVGPILKWLFKFPIVLYRSGLGWIIGDYVLLLTIKGRKTGRLRHTPVEYIFEPTRKATGSLQAGPGTRIGIAISWRIRM